ncbi:uncharacterized protein [Lepeophtheirus salmonis]|uniref:uncharacterized protein n=1 Tax=Lepeophtheirus salmonis TaxID=72036 RepID=UPI001AE7AE81|nr:uncharacterized protein LOC121132363 [Lepeophtheirus salmonis]
MDSPGSSSSSDDISDNKPPEHEDGTFRYVDVKEGRRIERFLENGCSCSLGPSDLFGNNTPCFNRFSYERVAYQRDQCLEMSFISPLSHEAYVFGHFAPLDKEDQKFKFLIGGLRVCLITFSFLLAMKESTIVRLYTHYLENGFTHKQPTLTEKPSKNLSNQSINEKRECIKHFLEKLMKDYGTFVEGRASSHYDFPSHWTREIVYNKYKESCLDQGHDNYCSRSTFIRHWKTVCPELCIMVRGSNLPEKKIVVKNAVSLGSSKETNNPLLKSIKKEPDLSRTEFINIPSYEHNDFVAPSTSPSIDVSEDSKSFFSSETNCLAGDSSSSYSINPLEGT